MPKFFKTFVQNGMSASEMIEAFDVDSKQKSPISKSVNRKSRKFMDLEDEALKLRDRRESRKARKLKRKRTNEASKGHPVVNHETSGKKKLVHDNFKYRNYVK
jgi:hypothetical protein